MEYTNPLIFQRADPFIYRHTNGVYYYTATVPEYDRIELLQADTIEGLRSAPPKTIWEKHTEGALSHLIWAPEIHFLRQKWYIYFAAAPVAEIHSEHNTFRHRMYVLEADNPDGPWQEKEELVTGMESFCLDATCFELAEKLYYVWAQKDPAIRGNSNLYLAEMENPWTLTGPHILLSKPEYTWECSVIPVNEGPAVRFHKNKIFVSYSANATGEEYCMGLLWADSSSNLLEAGSWHKSTMPVFESCKTNNKFGPGHNSFTLAEDGTTPLLVYHVRDQQSIEGDPLSNPDRNTCVQPFDFDAQGMPRFGVPLPTNRKNMV